MSPRIALRLVLGLMFIAALACNPIPSVPALSTLQAAATAFGTVSAVIGASAAFTPMPTPAWDPSTYLPARLEQKALTLDSMAISSNGSDFYGPILSIQVTDPGTQKVLTTIPCGLIFEPDNKDLQRLMVVQAFSATVNANSSAELKPYVICIDDTKHAPADGSTYKIGNLAGGDLLKLAACVCTQPLTFNTDLGREFGLQFAIWRTSDPNFPPADLSSTPLGPVIQPFLQLGMNIANGWLTSCGLKAAS